MSTVVDLYDHKIGATFELNGSVPLDPYGQYITSVESQIYRYGAYVQDLAVTILSATATDYLYTLTATASETALWESGEYRLDIKYTLDGGGVAYTQTMRLPVVDRETV